MEEQIVSDWRTASYSGNGGGNCVEVGSIPGSVAVRDSTYPDRMKLSFTPAGWSAFLHIIKES